MKSGEKWLWADGESVREVVLGLVNTKQVQIRLKNESGRTLNTKWVSPSSLSRVPGESVIGPDEPVLPVAVGTEEAAGDDLSLSSGVLAAETGLSTREGPEDLFSHLPIG